MSDRDEGCFWDEREELMLANHEKSGDGEEYYHYVGPILRNIHGLPSVDKNDE